MIELVKMSNIKIKQKATMNYVAKILIIKMKKFKSPNKRNL